MSKKKQEQELPKSPCAPAADHAAADYTAPAETGAVFLLDCAAAQAADLARRLGFYKLRAKVAVTNASDDLGVVAVWKGAPSAGGLIYPDPRDARLGFRTIAPRAEWLYAVPGRVLDALRAAGVIDKPVIRIFGHSAGGQFVHRMLATEGGTPFAAAMPRNSSR